MADRRDPLADVDSAVKNLIGKRRAKGQRAKTRESVRYPSEEKRVKGTWDLKAATLERVRAAAKELGVAQYSLVEKLVNEGLDRWEEGEMKLERVAVVTTWGIE